MKPEELLFAEYRHFSTALLKNEELGERRVSFFISLITAVMAGLVALWKTFGEPASNFPLRLITSAALLTLAVFGFVTFLRMLQRNHVTDEFKGLLDYLRERLSALAPAELQSYDLPFRSSRPRWLRGGLAPTVAALNWLILAVLGWINGLAWFPAAKTAGPPLGALGGLVVGVVLHWFLARRPAAKSEQFRAGVGAVILHGGRVLCFERRDKPGSWQLPQGGIGRGESVEAALFREIEEETGINRRLLKRIGELPYWVGYELKGGSRSRKTGRGQVHRWFFLEFKGSDADVTLPAKGEFQDKKWRELRELAGEVFTVKRPVYRQLVSFLEAGFRT